MAAARLNKPCQTKSWRDDRAGRRCTIGNRVCPTRVPGVRIPISPPDFTACKRMSPKRTPLTKSLLVAHKPLRRHTPCGGVAEWLNAAVSKTVSPVTRVTRVRIPPPPPVSNEERFGALFLYLRASSERNQTPNRCFSFLLEPSPPSLCTKAIHLGIDFEQPLIPKKRRRERPLARVSQKRREESSWQSESSMRRLMRFRRSLKF